MNKAENNQLLDNHQHSCKNMQVEGVMGGPHLEEQVTFGIDKSPSGIHEIKDKALADLPLGGLTSLYELRVIAGASKDLNP